MDKSWHNKNPRGIVPFDRDWFRRHQRKLLWLLNTPLVCLWFRWVMRIRGCDCGIREKICEIGPSYYVVDLGEGKYRADFRTHAKFSKRMYFAFRPLWWTLHAWDLFADLYIPELSFGFTTLTVYPQPNPATTAGDGYVGRQAVDETFSQIQSRSGTTADSSSNIASVALSASTTTNQFQILNRSIFAFDTSSIGSTPTVLSATISFVSSNKNNGIGAPDLHTVKAAPASNKSFVSSDYGTFTLGTSYGSIAYTSFVADSATYNNISLNSSGLANINKTGVSVFGAVTSWDQSGSFTGTWNSGANSSFTLFTADQSGTSQDPKLVVTYSTYSVSAPSTAPSSAKIQKGVSLPRAASAPSATTPQKTISLPRGSSAPSATTRQNTISLLRGSTAPSVTARQNTISLPRAVSAPSVVTLQRAVSLLRAISAVTSTARTIALALTRPVTAPSSVARFITRAIVSLVTAPSIAGGTMIAVTAQSDSGTLSPTELPSLFGSFTASDTGTLLSSETALAIQLLFASDSGTLSDDEQALFLLSFPANDSGTVTATESPSAFGTLNPSESPSLTASEQPSSFGTLLTADSGTLQALESIIAAFGIFDAGTFSATETAIASQVTFQTATDLGTISAAVSTFIKTIQAVPPTNFRAFETLRRTG